MTPRQFGLLILVSALWGGKFLLVKYALRNFSALEVAFLQAVIGALGLFTIVGFQSGEAPGASPTRNSGSMIASA